MSWHITASWPKIMTLIPRVYISEMTFSTGEKLDRELGLRWGRMRCDEEKAFYPSKKQDVERVTDSDRGAEDVGLAIRTVLSTWEGQALAGELDVAPPGSCTRTGLPLKVGALENDLFFGGTWAANGTGGVRLRACPLRRLVRERQTAPVLELGSRTTGMTLAGGGRAFRDP